MINELIKKEIDKLISLGGCNVCAPNDKEILTNSFKTIAKEVAMRFKQDNLWEPETEYDKGYILRCNENNNLVDQIIGEVSE